MTEVVLILTLYCSVPVSAMLSYPKDGQQVVSMTAVAPEYRQFWLDLARKIEAANGTVHRIKAEAQVEGVKCGAST